jgi:hypothetical protein
LQDGDIPLYKLNFGLVTLLPKKEDTSRIEQYRPIYLLNVSFNFFTKVDTNRVTVIAHKMVRPTQLAFIPGKNILEGVVVLHKLSMSFTGRKWMVSFSKLILKRHMIR